MMHLHAIEGVLWCSPFGGGGLPTGRGAQGDDDNILCLYVRGDFKDVYICNNLVLYFVEVIP